MNGAGGLDVVVNKPANLPPEVLRVVENELPAIGPACPVLPGAVRRKIAVMATEERRNFYLVTDYGPDGQPIFVPSVVRDGNGNVVNETTFASRAIMPNYLARYLKDRSA